MGNFDKLFFFCGRGIKFLIKHVYGNVLMAKYILTFMYMYVHMYNLKSFSRLWNNNSPEDNVLAL